MRKYIFIISTILLLVLAGFFAYLYYYGISDGYRVGRLIKFSRKGIVFKTYEGELVQEGFSRGSGVNSKDFYFSVCDEAIADSLNKVLGRDVKVHYIQYLKSLPWRGENYNDLNDKPGQYIIDRIEKVEERQDIGF